MTIHRTAAKRGSKYGNRKVTTNGYTFDSAMEERRYQELLILQSAMRIKALKVHPEYLIHESYRQAETGKTIPSVAYEADFEYFDCDDRKWVTEDVKGVETAVFKLKRKLFEARYHRLLRTVQA